MAVDFEEVVVGWVGTGWSMPSEESPGLEHEKWGLQEMGREDCTFPSKASRNSWPYCASSGQQDSGRPDLEQRARNNQPKDGRGDYSGTPLFCL